MNKLLFYFLLFLIYSFIGWLIEVIVTFVKNKKFVNRGFLIGPYCPIYGYSSIIMIFYLERYKDNILTVFLLAVIVCTFIEYIISYIMEKIFNARWWDYTNRKFNINGRVCLTNAFAFGILGILLVYFVNPFLTNILLKLNYHFLNIISIVFMTLFIIDFVTSLGVTFKLKNSIKKLNKDNTEEFNNKIKEVIENKVLNRRIFKAFPKYKMNIIKDKLHDIKKEFENKIDEKIEKK